MEEAKRGGGPKTAEGKARSSGNSSKHGLRQRGMRLVADETPEEYEAHCRNWEQQLQPGSFLEEQMMKQLVLNSWLMERANRRYLEVEAEGDQHAVELMQRYKTTAERAFYRSVDAVKRLSKDTVQAQFTVDKLECERAQRHTTMSAVFEQEKRRKETGKQTVLTGPDTGERRETETRSTPSDYSPGRVKSDPSS